METRSFLALVLVALLLLASMLLPLNTGYAQDIEGRWGYGIHGGGNFWYNDYNKRVVGEGGELMARYGFTRTLSVGLLVGYEELKSNQDPALDGVAYLKLQAIPASIVGWYRFAPEWPINPFLYAGLGTMVYHRVIGGNVSTTGGLFKSSIHVPFGVGLEISPSRNFSLAFDLGYRVIADNSDGRTTGALNGYAVAKAGVNFYFGLSSSEKEEISRAEAQRIIDFREAKAQRLRELLEAEAKRVRDSSEAEAQRILDSTAAEARRQAELSASRPADTLFFVVSQKTINLKGINFETNTARLTESSRASLTLVREALKTNPEIKVRIVGHTDNTGRIKFNKNLSLQRAKAVRSWLVREGIRSKRMTVAGEGPDNPIDDNATPEGRANNRRIEFRVVQ